MDFLRGIVSGKKKRYDQSGFNLDLTYITERIIAMCFPSSGFESFYRNDIDDVVNFLEAKHKDHYLIMNLGGRPYDYKKFNNQVKEFEWEDHHSPNLDTLFAACRVMDEFIQKSPENVIVVHCNAGKGRTGTLISCYLVYSGRFQNESKAMEYYKKKRFASGGGVTQPSQIRYVEYFSNVLNNHLKNEPAFQPVVTQFDKIVIHGMPKVNFTGFFQPFVEVYDVRNRKILYTTKKGDDVPKFPPSATIVTTMTIPQLLLSGDILIRVNDLTLLNHRLICRLGFNTSFLQFDSENKAKVELRLGDLDPDSLHKDNDYPANFKVELFFTLAEPSESSHIFSNLLTVEKKNWGKIYESLQNYQTLSEEESKQRLFMNVENDDVEKIVSKNPFGTK